MDIPNRDEQHGGMEAVGKVSQRIKAAMRDGRNWSQLTPGEQEAMDMTAHKIARVLSGSDPHDPEHWVDVAGYPHAAVRGRWASVKAPASEDSTPKGEAWRHLPVLKPVQVPFRRYVWPEDKEVLALGAKFVEGMNNGRLYYTYRFRYWNTSINTDQEWDILASTFDEARDIVKILFPLAVRATALRKLNIPPIHKDS